MNDLLSRKFIYALVAVILSYSLVIAGKLDAQTWTNFVSIIGGIYVIGNIAEKTVEK